MSGWVVNPAPSNDDMTPWLFQPQARKRRPYTPMTRSVGVSPFTDCPDTLENGSRRGIALPPDGQVNGYIKFSSTKQGRRASTQGLLLGHVTTVPADYGRLPSWLVPWVSLSESPATLEPAAPCRRATNMTHDIAQQDRRLAAGYDRGSALGRIGAGPGSYGGPMGSPRLLPESFGYDAKTDGMDGFFWAFCMSLSHYTYSRT